MDVTIRLSATLRTYCHEDAAEIILSAATVRGALAQIERTHLPLYQSICDETGAIRRHVHLFVNDSLVHDRTGLDMPLEPNDVISIMPAVSGG